MTTYIGQWRLERNTLWRTVDGNVYFFRRNSGWVVGSTQPAVKQQLAHAGISWESVGYNGHARTRSDALAIAHAVTGCETQLQIPRSEFIVSGTPLVLSRISGTPQWEFTPSGIDSWNNAATTNECQALQGQWFDTRAAALEALGDIIGEPPTDDHLIHPMTDDERDEMLERTW